MTKRRATPGSGSIYKHDTRDLWVGQITIGGRRRRVYAETKTGARAKLNELLGGGPDIVRAAPDRSLAVTTLLDEWLAVDVNGRDIAPSTADRHRWAVEHLRAEIGAIAVASLTVRHVETALAHLAATGLGKASLTKILQTLAQALTFAERRDDVSRNVAKLAKVPATAAAAVKRQSLSPVEARALLVALEDERNGLMFAIGLRLGLRPGEATGLYWTDLDLDAGTVNVTRGVRMVKGRAEVVDDLKTSGAKRTLAIAPDLVEAFRRHRVAQTAERLAATTWADERLVFASPRGGVLSPPNVRRHLAAVCTHAGVTVIRPNELRHSCASYLVDAGVGIEVVADVLGHTSTRMVDATYRHRLRPVVDITAAVDWGTTAAN